MTHSPQDGRADSQLDGQGVAAAAIVGAAPVRRPPLDLKPYVLPLLRGWWLVLLVFGLAFGLGLRTVKTATPTYEVSALIASKTGSSSAGALNSGLLASLLPQTKNSGFEKFKVLISSPTVLEQLQEDMGILQIVYQSSWDEAKGDWRPIQESEYDRRWRELVQMPPPSPPSIEKLSKSLASAIVIENDELFSSFTRITYEHHDPKFATWLVKELVARADTVLKREKRQELDQQLLYLKGRLELVNAQEYRQFLMELISQQDKELMLISSDGPYAIEYVTEFTASEQPKHPNVTRTLGMHAAAGLVLGIGLAFLLDGMRRRLFW